MSRRRGVLVVTTAAVVTLAACSLTTDLDGLSGGPVVGNEGGPTLDGTTLGDGTAPANDGGTDAPVSEAGIGCPNKPVVVCEEFLTDEKANGWTVVQEGAGMASVVEDPDGGLRGGYFSAPETLAGAAPLAYWSKSFDKTVSKLNFDTDLYYDFHVKSAPEYHVLFQLVVTQGATYQVMYLTVPDVNNGWALQDFPNHADNIDYRTVNVLEGQVHHVHFDVEVGGRSRFSVDGVVLQDNPTPAFMKAGLPTLNIGVALSSTVPSTVINAGYAHVVFTGE